MITEKPLNVVLKDMTLVHKLAKKSGLKPSKLKGSNTAAIRLAEYLGITKKQVYLLSSTFFLNLKQSFVNIMDVGNHFDMDEDDVVAHSYTALVQTLDDIFENVKQRLLKSNELLNGSDTLTKLGLIRVNGAQMLSDATIELTETAMELFLGEHLLLFANDFEEDYMKHESLTKKDLYFDSELDKQLNFLQNSLMNENYLKMQERLASMGMRKGVAAILYGEPGTGKTESVYQLAKETGRGIIHVNISETKSKWFGESEKKIKEVFTKYERICKRVSVKPILLFNEADAIFGKRKEVGSNSVDQTENTIQNIILEEMEKLEGILIATTNLATNLDPAFERRFLFKIRFGKPSLEVNERIWRSKVEWLDEEGSRRLAASYGFSGGEIDNVVRKVAMEEVLTGVRPGVEKVAGFCEEERLSGKGQRKRVGFVDTFISGNRI